MKKILGKLMMITLVLMLTMSDFLAIPLQNKDDIQKYGDENILVTYDVKVDEKTPSEGLLQLDIVAKTDVEILGIETENGEMFDGTSLSIPIFENKIYNLDALYKKENEIINVAVPIEVTELEPTSTGDIIDDPEIVDSSISVETFSPVTRSTSQVASLQLSKNNASLKTEEDYVFAQADQKSFKVHLTIIPQKYEEKNRNVTLKIPKYFGIEEGVLERLTHTFKTIDIDYAGNFDPKTEVFTWEDNKTETVITFGINESDSVEKDTPINLEFTVYQDFYAIGSKGVTPYVEYNFTTENNMDNKESGFSLKVPFSDAGIKFIGTNNGKLLGETQTAGGVSVSHLFTISDKSLLFGDLNTVAVPRTLKSVDLKFQIKREPASQSSSYSISVPLPTGYILDNEKGPSLVVNKGGIDDNQLNLNKNTAFDWYEYDELQNIVMIKLDESFAKGLLANMTLGGNNIGEFNLPILRVNNDMSTYNSDIQNLPYPLTGNEVQVANKPIVYTDTNAADGSVVETADAALSVKVPEFITETRVFGSQSKPASITKNSVNQSLGILYISDANNNLSTMYKDMKVIYNVSDLYKKKSDVTIKAFSGVQLDKYVKIQMVYTNQNNQQVTVNIPRSTQNPELQEQIVVGNLDFASDIKSIEQIELVYPFVAGKGDTAGTLGRMNFVVDTDVKHGSNNDTESFVVSAYVLHDGQTLISNDFQYNLLQNNYSLSVTTRDNSTTNAYKYKNSGAMFSGSLAISAFYPSEVGSYMDITSGNFGDSSDGLQHIEKMVLHSTTIPGATIKYRVAGDTTEYTIDVDGLNQKTIEFSEIDKSSNRLLTELKIYPKELDNQTIHKTLTWELHPFQSKVPSAFFDEISGEREEIAENQIYTLNQQYHGITPNDQGSTLVSQSTGKSYRFLAANQPLVFSKMDREAENIATIQRTYTQPYMSFQMTGKTNSGQETRPYENAHASINFDDLSVEEKAQTLDMLSLASQAKLIVTGAVLTDKNVSVTYTKKNLSTAVQESITKTIQSPTNGSNIDFELQENEVLVNISFETDAYLDMSSTLSMGMEFYLKDSFVPELTPYARSIAEKNYEIPMKLDGKEPGKSISLLDEKIMQTVEFKALIPPTSMGEPTDTSFRTHNLSKTFSEANYGEFAYIVDGHTFKNPILEWSIQTYKGLADIPDAEFSLKESLDKNILSSIGHIVINTSTGPAWQGKVVYKVYDSQTGTILEKELEINGQQLKQDLSLVVEENEYLVDAILQIDNLKNFDRTQKTTVSYYFKNDKTTSTFLELVDYSKHETIPDGYATDAQASFTYRSGVNRINVNSKKGASVNFYSMNNRMKLAVDTAYPKLSYFKDQLPGYTAGLNMTIYPDTTEYTNAKFEVSVRDGDVNEQFFTFIEAIEINGSLSAGAVNYYVQKTDGTIELRSIPFIKQVAKQYLELDLAPDEYVVGFKDPALSGKNEKVGMFITFDKIMDETIPREGKIMKIDFLFTTALGDIAKNGVVVKPARSYAFNATFTADEYDITTGQENFTDIPGTLVDHNKKVVDTAKFGTYEAERIPENFKVSLNTQKEQLVAKAQDGVILSDRPISEVHQGNKVDFEHVPKIQWQYPRTQLAPERAYLDNPKLYYIIDKNFNYVNNSFEFYDQNGQKLETEVLYHPDVSTEYSVLEVYLKDMYELDLGELQTTYESAYFEMGEVKFSLTASREKIATNIQGVKDSYVDVDFNITNDPANHIYEHVTTNYLTQAQTGYNLGNLAGVRAQFLPLGASTNFTVLLNNLEGVSNIATSPLAEGETVEGSDITQFGNKISIAAPVRTLYDMTVYIPIPQKNFSYIYYDSQQSTSVELGSDYTMKLTDAVSGTFSGSSSAFQTEMKVEYGGDNSVDTTYPTRAGLTGNTSTETAYETFDSNKQENYTMIRLTIPKLSTSDNVLLTIPMMYTDVKPDDSDESAQLNLEYRYSLDAANTSSILSSATTLTYNVSTYELSGRAWLDTTNNNVFNAGSDQVLEGIEVTATLKNSNDPSKIYTTTTNEYGEYRLTVPGGDYVVSFPDRFTGFEYPDQMDFVVPRYSQSDQLDSKVSRTKDATYGTVETTVNMRSVSNLNAGYYIVPKENILDDMIIWEGDEATIVKPIGNLPPITIPDQSLYSSTNTLIAVVKNEQEVSGRRRGEVDVTYTYPDGIGGTIESSFKLTVLPVHTVNYVVKEDDVHVINGSLVAPENPTSDFDVSSMSESIYESKSDNRVKNIPTVRGDKTREGQYVFEDWYVWDGTDFVRFDLTSQITEDTTIYANLTLTDGADVTVRYVKDNATQDELNSPIILNGKIGAAYTTEQKTFSGYTFKEVIGNESGEFTSSSQEVVYVYTIDDQKVDVEYQTIGHTRDISEHNETLEGEIGTAYDYTPKVVEDYTFKEIAATSEPLQGTFEITPQKVILLYEANEGANIIYSYEDEQGQPLYDMNEQPIVGGNLTGLIDAPYDLSSAQSAQFSGYTYKETVGDVTGTFTNTTQYVRFIYTAEASGTVIYRYRDTNGNPVKLSPTSEKEDVTLTGVQGQLYDGNEGIIVIPGYSYIGLSGDSAPLQGHHTQETKTVIFVYEELEAEPVTVQYRRKDDPTVILAEDVVLNGKYYDAYNVENPSQVKEIEEYTFSEWDATQPTSGYFDDVPKTVTALYDHDIYRVNIVYRSVDGEDFTTHNSVLYDEAQNTQIFTPDSIEGYTFINYSEDEMLLHDQYKTRLLDTEIELIFDQPEKTVYLLFAPMATVIDYRYEDVEGKQIVSNGNEILGDTIYGQFHQAYDLSDKIIDIPAYEFVETKGDPISGIHTLDKQEVIFVYRQLNNITPELPTTGERTVEFLGMGAGLTLLSGIILYTYYRKTQKR